MFRPTVLAAGIALALAFTAPAFAADSAFIAKAVADASRPDADKSADADRKPTETLAFSGLKAGDKVVDFFPGGGYFTRIFAKSVGGVGKVYALGVDGPRAEPMKKLAAEPGYSNVTFVAYTPGMPVKLPEAVDFFWTSRNYHDFHNIPNLDIAALNKSIYDALKPGGIYIVLDHAAATGSGVAATNTLHRIDPELVKKEVTAAGFKFVGESKVLAHPADDHTQKVFEGAVKGKTDQFILKFQK